MIDCDEALAIILAHTPAPTTMECACAKSVGRVLAGAITSPADLPPFDNAAMDGFALHAGDAQLARGSRHAVLGTQVAGDAHARAKGGAWEITTGARLPAGMDTVVPVEQVTWIDRDAGAPPCFRLGVEVRAGQHVRRQGEDVRRGTVVMAAGDVVQAQHLALFAALGIDAAPVVRRPRVAIICTGRELVDDPAQVLQSGQIRNSSGPFLAARAAAAGAEVVSAQTIGDDPAAFVRAVAHALDVGAQVLLCTGAVSMGRHDFVPDAVRTLGAQIHFHKVRIRPGKPLLFATLPGGSLFFGLPGNPVATAVGLRFFVEPALRAMLGLPVERPLRVPLHEPLQQRTALHCFLKGHVGIDDGGQLRASVLAGQESFRIRPLLEANAWIVVGESAAPVTAGTLVDVYGRGHLQAPVIRSDA